jgi:hypothetical protein
MRRSIAVLVLLLAAACASGPQKLAGNYGVVIDPLMTESERRAIPSVGDSIKRALADRLERLTVVRSPLATGYDAVIVLRYGGGNLFGHSAPKDTLSRFTIVEYEIMRGGSSVGKGEVRLGGVIRVEGVGTASAPTWKDAIAGGIEVARVVVKELATPQAARSR